MDCKNYEKKNIIQINYYCRIFKLYFLMFCNNLIVLYLGSVHQTKYIIKLFYRIQVWIPQYVLHYVKVVGNNINYY